MSTEVKKLINMVHDVDSQIKQNFANINAQGEEFKNKTVVLLLGPTGSGKTTLFYALTGKDLIVAEGSPFPILDVNDKDRDIHFQIGHGGRAKTTTPGLKYDSATDIIFCDCPGFFDNRGEIQDISNSFAISTVLSKAKKVKILLLTSCDDVKSAKGKPFRESCEIVEKLIPEQIHFQSIIGLVITHVDPEFCGDDVSFLKNVECGNGWLLNYFQKKEIGNDRIVFKFPSPTSKMVNQIYPEFNDKKHIINFIKNSSSTSRIVPYISLSDKAKLMILRCIDSFGCLLTLIQKFVDQIRIESTQSSSDLEAWKSCIYQLCRCEFQNPKDFVEKAKKIIPVTNLIQKIYDQFMEIQDWRSFLEKIALEGVKIKDEVIRKDSQLLSPVFLDITLNLSNMLTPVISILNTKIELNKIEAKNIKADDDLSKINEMNDKIKNQILEEQVQAQKRQDDLKKELEVQKRELERAQRDLEQARREAEAARNSGGGFFGSICRFVAGAVTAAWLL